MLYNEQSFDFPPSLPPCKRRTQEQPEIKNVALRWGGCTFCSSLAHSLPLAPVAPARSPSRIRAPNKVHKSTSSCLCCPLPVCLPPSFPPSPSLSKIYWITVAPCFVENHPPHFPIMHLRFIIYYPWFYHTELSRNNKRHMCRAVQREWGACILKNFIIPRSVGGKADRK
jgi:hypothetical protein